MPRRNQQRTTNTARQSGRRKPKPIKFNPREIEIEQQQQQQQHEHHHRMSASEHNNAVDGSAPDGMDNVITIGINENDSIDNENIERTNQMDNNVHGTLIDITDKSTIMEHPMHETTTTIISTTVADDAAATAAAAANTDAIVTATNSMFN